MEAGVLVACGVCGVDVARTARACPKCGAPQAGGSLDTTVKRVWLLLGLLALLVVGGYVGTVVYVGTKTATSGVELKGTFGPSR
jgi:hypothetical protein